MELFINNFLSCQSELSTMNHKLFGSLVTDLALLAILPVSFPIAWSERDYCYDQAGSGHFCFETQKDCSHKQKQDDTAETPCYNKDRTA